MPIPRFWSGAAVCAAALLLASCGIPAATPASVPPAGVPTQAPAAAAPTAAPDPPTPAVPTAIPTPAATPTPAPPPGVTILPAAPAKRIGPLLFISQTLNNCGPASVAEVLDYFDVHRTQAQVASVLRPSLPDYGMSLYGVPFYAESVGMKTLGGVGANQELLKALISNGIPVIVADLVSTQERIRHFRPIDGYDDAGGYFIGSDPYLGPNHKISYPEFDELWKISQNQFIAVFPPDKQPLVEAVAAQHWDKTAAARSLVSTSLQRIAQQSQSPAPQQSLPRGQMGWGWMGLADAQIQLGDFPAAAQSLRKAADLGPAFEAHWLQLKLDRAQKGEPI